MRSRGALIGLSLFMVVAVALTWLVYVTLRRDVTGPTVPYSAIFTDVFGLREGDDVRMAGVRVGRVERIELQGKYAKVDFVVQADQQVLGNTVASVTYQNIVGQRYLGLSLGNLGDPHPLQPGSTIPVEQTDPSFDVGTLLNGYEPLFSVLDPKHADNLTKGVIESLQGDEGSITALVDQTAQLTEAFAGKDEELGAVITDLNLVVANLARHNDDLDHIVDQARTVVTTFDARRNQLIDSMGVDGEGDPSTVGDLGRGLPAAERDGAAGTGVRQAHARHRTAAGVRRRQSAVDAQGIRPRHRRGHLRQRLRLQPRRHRVLPRPQRRDPDHRRGGHARQQSPVHPEVQEPGQWLTRHERLGRPGARWSPTARPRSASPPSRWSRCWSAPCC